VSDGSTRRGKIWHLHEPAVYKLKTVLTEIKKFYNYSCLFIPLPSAPVLAGVIILEHLPFLKLPVSSTNLKGLREAKNEKFRSDFNSFGYEPKGVSELIKTASEEKLLEH
jgi:hypothetical protein